MIYLHQFKNVYKNARVYYSVMMIINMIAGLVMTAAATHTLKPNDWGAIQEYLLWASYSTILGFGVPNAVNRQVAFYLAIKDGEKVFGIVRRSWVHACHISSIGTVIGLLIIYHRLVKHTTETALIGSLVFIIFVATEPFVNHLDSVFLSSQRYQRLAYVLALQALVQIIGGYLIFTSGLWGFFFARTLFALSRLLPKLINMPIKPIASASRINLQELVKVGVPLLFVGFAANQFNSFDRIIASVFLDEATIGNLSVSTIITSGMAYIPQIIAALYYAKMVEKYAATKDLNSIRADTVQMLFVACVITFFVSVTILALIVPLCTVFFRQYISTVNSVKINIIGSVFLGVNSLTVIYAVVQKSQYVLLQLLVSCLIVLATFLILEDRVDVLTNLAFSKLVGNVSFAFLLCIFVKRMFYYENKM